MRFTSETLGLLLLFGVVHAQSAYDATCSPPPPPDQEIEPGIVVTYTCGKGPDNKFWNGATVESASTPKECAEKCAKRTSDGPCSWYGNQCFQYNPGGAVVSITDMVMIETRKDWDKMKKAYDDCMAKGGGGGPPGGGPPTSADAKDCLSGGSTGGSATAGGKEYETYCGYCYDHDSIMKSVFSDGTKDETLADCLQSCNTRNGGCQAVDYNAHTKLCKRYPTATGAHRNPKYKQCGDNVTRAVLKGKP